MLSYAHKKASNEGGLYPSDFKVLIQSVVIDSLFTESKQGKQRSGIASSFQVV